MRGRGSILPLARVLTLSLTLLGCSSSDGAAADLENIQWKLTKASTGGAPKDVPAAASVYAEFRDGTVSGKAVNSYSGPYQVDENGGLSIGKLSSTLMAGPPELQAVEDAYFAALGRTASYTSDGSTLILYDADRAPILVFSRIEVGLVGSWNVTAYNNGRQAVVSVLPTSTITMSFAADGTLAGDTGINAYNARYTTSGADGIEIGPIATTRKAGPPDLMQQEQSFLAALSASKTYQVRGETLELRDSSGALQVTAVRAP